MVSLTYYCVCCTQRRNKTCEFRHPDNQCPEIYRICGKLSSNTLKSTKPKRLPKLSRRPIHNPLLHQESRDEKIWVTGHKALHHFIEGKWVDGYDCSVIYDSATLAKEVTLMLAIKGCCGNLPGCVTALRSVQDKHTQKCLYFITYSNRCLGTWLVSALSGEYKKSFILDMFCVSLKAWCEMIMNESFHFYPMAISYISPLLIVSIIQCIQTLILHMTGVWLARKKH